MTFPSLCDIRRVRTFLSPEDCTRCGTVLARTLRTTEGAPLQSAQFDAFDLQLERYAEVCALRETPRLVRAISCSASALLKLHSTRLVRATRGSAVHGFVSTAREPCQLRHGSPR